MPKITDIIDAKVGNVHLTQIRVGSTVIWPTSHTYTYRIDDITVNYSQSASYILANATNYAYLTGTVVVFRDGVRYDTLYNEPLSPVKVSGDSNLTVSSSHVVGTHRHTTQGTARTATFRGSYEGTQSTFAVTVTQQENQPTQDIVPMLTFTSSWSEISYTGDTVPISYVSKSKTTITWTSGDTQSDIISDVTSTLSANIGTFDVDRVTGSGTVYLTVPANSSYSSRSVVASMTYSGYSESVTFTQAAMEHPLEWYISAYTGSPTYSKRSFYIENRYTSPLTVNVTMYIKNNNTGDILQQTYNGIVPAGGTVEGPQFSVYGYDYDDDHFVVNSVHL